MVFCNHVVARKPFPRVGKISSLSAQEISMVEWAAEYQGAEAFCPEGLCLEAGKKEKAIDSPITTAKLVARK